MTETKYDLAHYYRDSLLASSGTLGDWLDIALIPKFLGDSMPERVQKYLAYKKKAGVGLLDSSQEGVQFNNTLFSGYDNTIKSQAIEAIELTIDRLENTCSSITGVFRERLNGIQQRDAVSNIKLGAQNSYIITKQYNHQMDILTTEILNDCLNLAKIVWKKGLKGTFILGDKYQKIFTALPEYFTVTDFDINIESGASITRDMEVIKQLMPELVKSGMLSSDEIIDMITSKSMTQLKTEVKASMKKRKEEEGVLQQLQQQLEQAQQQLKQAAAENKELQNKIDSLNEAKISLDREELKYKTELEWYKARSERNFKEATAETNKKKADIEYGQLFDGNKYNDKVRD